MATIRKRGSRYQAVVRRQGKTAYKSFTRRRDAERWATTQEAAIESGDFHEERAGGRKPLADWLQRYRRDVAPGMKGWKQLKSRLNVLLKAPFSSTPIADVTPTEIANWRDVRLRTTSANTVRNDLVTLSSVYEHARKEWRVVRDNPAQAIRWPSMPRGRERRVRPDEERALLAAASTKRERALLVLLIETGMRLGEALGVRYPEHLDLEARTIELPETKNGTARTVPLSRRAVEVLKTVPVAEDGRLFPWTSSTWGHRFEKIREGAGVGDVRTHDLRHEAVSRLFERGFNVMEVAAISGHKTLAMLQRYTHLQAPDLLARLDATQSAASPS